MAMSGIDHLLNSSSTANKGQSGPSAYDVESKDSDFDKVYAKRVKDNKAAIKDRAEASAEAKKEQRDNLKALTDQSKAADSRALQSKDSVTKSAAESRALKKSEEDPSEAATVAAASQSTPEDEQLERQAIASLDPLLGTADESLLTGEDAISVMADTTTMVNAKLNLESAKLDAENVRKSVSSLSLGIDDVEASADEASAEKLAKLDIESTQRALNAKSFDANQMSVTGKEAMVLDEQKLNMLRETVQREQLFIQTDKLSLSDNVQAAAVNSTVMETAVIQQANNKTTGPVQETVSFFQQQRLGTDGWADGMASRVLMMAGQKVQTAQIYIDPPELGPIEVKISQQQDQTQVVFTTQHGAVKDALEASIARLKEMFEQQGMGDIDAEVRDGDPGEEMSQSEGEQLAEQGKGSGNLEGNAENNVAAENDNEVSVEMSASDFSDGRVDHYV